jgi:hypothetical protein
VQAAWVVPALNPGKDFAVRLSLGFPYLAINQLALQGGKETFCHRIVVGVADGAHGGFDIRNTHLALTFSTRAMVRTANLA